MTGFVHALIGAVAGSRSKNRAAAFATGVITHAIGDVIPHKEAPVWVDVPLLAGALGVLAWRFGLQSKEIAGTIGGIAPDFEHVPSVFGLKSPDDGLFPTHSGLLPHGRGYEYLSQAVIAAVCIVVLAIGE